jgi:uncharacterized protein
VGFFPPSFSSQLKSYLRLFRLQSGSLCFLAVLALLSAGCAKKPAPLSGAQIRGITRELVFAAKNASDGSASTGMMPERISSSQPAPQSAAQARRGQNRGPAPAADMIFISLPALAGGRTNQAVLTAVENELARIAQEHRLTRVARPGAPGVIRFDYYYAGARTHAVHIITPLLSNAGMRPVSDTGQNHPKLAIILDDLGYDRGAADAILQMPFPLTLSVLPHLPHSADIAEDAFRRGYQVMLHLPVESDSGQNAEAMELRPGMPPELVAHALEDMLDTVPHAVGVNNHQGSLGTSDTSLMDEVMPALRDRDLFFVDSRTTARSVAFDAARRAHVPTASRDIFLDDVQEAAAIRRELEQAVRDARMRGTAVAIGHPHPATLEVLDEELPQLEREGVGLVFVSQIVR